MSKRGKYKAQGELSSGVEVRKGFEEEGLFKLSFEEQAEFGHREVRESGFIKSVCTAVCMCIANTAQYPESTLCESDHLTHIAIPPKKYVLGVPATSLSRHIFRVVFSSLDIVS